MEQKDSHSSINPWSKRARFLTQLLVLSGTLNVALLATFSYFLLRDKRNESVPFSQVSERQFSEKKLDTSTNAEVLRTYCEKSFHDLVLLLENGQYVEDGYAKRDLALAVLVAFHHFNLERALGGITFSARKILLSPYRHAEQIDLTMFPGLSEEQFQAIMNYAKTERWPLTNQGLYFEVKRSLMGSHTIETIDKSLLNTFCLSSEFLAVTTLLTRTGCNLSKEEIVQFVCEGNWSLLERFAAVQKYAQDFSIDRLRALLLEYLDVHAKTAARIFLSHDADFAVRRLQDEHIMMLLEEGKDDPRAIALAKAILCSTRSDRVYRCAASKLYLAEKEKMPEPYDHIAAVRRFCPEFFQIESLSTIPILPPALVTPVSSAESKKKKRSYTVQEGDSLWKIARKHRVEVEAIMKINHLESEKLRPGKQLEIPE